MMDIQSLIRKKAREAGIDPTHALTMASIESSFDPKAANKHGYKGLYQFGPNEWKQWGGGRDIFDPEANVDAFIGYQGPGPMPPALIKIGPDLLATDAKTGEVFDPVTRGYDRDWEWFEDSIGRTWRVTVRDSVATVERDEG